MKKIKSLLFTTVLAIAFTSCETNSETNHSVDISKYRGAALCDRMIDYRYKEPIGAYVHTFRLNDSIWSESYMYGCFALFNEGDTIK